MHKREDTLLKRQRGKDGGIHANFLLTSIEHRGILQASNTEVSADKGGNDMEKNGLAGSTALLVLSLLRDGDKYGYEMISQLALRSEGVFELKEGTLYPVLHQLEREGSLQSYQAESAAGRSRRYYRLTEKGLRVLEAQEAEFRRVAGAVEQVLRYNAV